MKPVVLILLAGLLLACSSPDFIPGTVIEKHMVPGMWGSASFLVIVETDNGGKVMVHNQDAYYLLKIDERVGVYYEKFNGRWSVRRGAIQ